MTDDVEPAQKSAVTTNVGAEPSSKQENSPPTTSASPTSSTQAPSQTTQTDAPPVSDQADPGNPRQIVIELQRLFAYLQEVDQIAVSTNPLTKSFGWENSEASQQQDVHELNRLLFEVIEESLVGTPQQNIIENLYKGTTTTQLCCLTCGNTKEHVEPFQDIPIIVHGFDSLEQSLQALTNWEPLTKENQYSCDQCGKKVDGKKGVRITQVPDILVLPLQRFEYNFKQQRREKINTPFQFPLVLDLAPFTKIMDDAAHTPDPLMYDLFAVLIHSGGAYGGHYHAMIRDITRKGEQQWFDFNDSSVTPIPELQLESTFGGSKECAYMLTYRRKSKDFVHTPVPEHCLKEIRCHNEKLKHIRVEHDTAVNQMYINVWGEAHLTLCDGVLTVNKEEKENEKVVFFDARQPLEALFKMVAEIPWLAPVLIGHYQLNEMWETTSGVVRINQLLCTSDDDKTLPIKKTPIRPASSVIVWNGKMISGMLYNPEQPSVLLMLSWKHSKNEAAARARIGISLNSTLTDLRQKLHQLTGIPPHQQIITKVDRGKRVRLVEEKATIFESKLFDANEVFLESVLNEEDSAPKSSATDAPIQIPDDTDMTIYITDWCTPIQPALSRSIVVPKDSTVAFLKKRVIDSVPLADYTVETTVLRRCLVGGAPGESLEDAIQLTSAGISDSMRLIIEPGTPATGVYSVNVKWNVPALGETPASQTVINLLIPKTTTLAECKELAAQQIGIDASSVRLRKADIFEMPADLVVDEAVPLDRAGVIDGGYIFLEKGKPLTKGEALVCFQLFDYLPAEESQNSSYESMYSGHFSPLLILSSRNSKNTDSRNGGHSKYINLLGEAQVPLSTTVGELLDTTLPPLLPPNPSGNKPIIRLWQGSKLLRKMSQSLKQLQVGYSDALLTIQLVNESVDPMLSLGADSILLYCCCRDPKSGLFHPNQEIVITTPTLGLLRTLLATKYDIEDKNLLLARCAASAARWSQIVHQQSETTETTAPQITPDTAAKTTTTEPETPPAVTETPTDNSAPPTESPATGGTAETPSNNSNNNTNKNKGKNQQQKQNQRGNAQTGAGKGGKGQQQARRPTEKCSAFWT
ncbi:peptidase C19 family protein [Pelomyxa schiedti]|nr:peptidase C19 family protein [Pelomyxa schiedti]